MTDTTAIAIPASSAITRPNAKQRWVERRSATRKLTREERFAGMRAVPSEADLAWGAGLFEGEGTITLSGTGCPYVIVGNTDRQVIDFYQRHWPGCVKGHNPANVNQNARPAWDWRIGGWKALIFLREMQPYFRTERVRAKAELVLDAGTLAHAERGEHVVQIRTLNRRGLRAV